MTKEIWKDVIGYEGSYEVSSLGRIKSIIRYNVRSDRILKPGLSNRGYLFVTLCEKGVVKTCTVHSLVAKAFIGPRQGSLQVDHINNVRTDNRVSNLEYVTNRENAVRGKLCLLNKTKLSKLVGASFCASKGKWRSTKRYSGTSYHLGYFDNDIDAANAYKNATEDSCKELIIKRCNSRSSKHKGVSWNKAYKKWQSRLYIEGNTIYLGNFDTEQGAISAIFNEKEKRRKGE